MSRPCRAPSERLPRGSRKPTAIVVCAPEGRVVFRAALMTRTRLTRLHPAHQPSPVIFHRVVLLFSTGAALTELPFPSYLSACLLPPVPPPAGEAHTCVAFVHHSLVSSTLGTASGPRQALCTIFWNKQMDDHKVGGFGVATITAFYLSSRS